MIVIVDIVYKEILPSLLMPCAVLPLPEEEPGVALAWNCLFDVVRDASHVDSSVQNVEWLERVIHWKVWHELR